jgi:predicted Zn-dependent peptidase
MDVIQAEMDKVISAPDAFRETHADSIADVKTYLAGSYALNFDSGKKIAGQLLGVQLIGFPITYFETRNERVHRVTMPQALRAADKLFHQTLRISSVGGTKIALPRQNP